LIFYSNLRLFILITYKRRLKRCLLTFKAVSDQRFTRAYKALLETLGGA
jgi:hypothetical protein